jgi:hypothetical protein
MLNHLVVLILVFRTTATQSGDTPSGMETIINFAGPRQAKAELRVSQGDYMITVRMWPVTSLDAVTNDRINRAKARQYALQALARFLSSSKPSQLRLRGATVEQARTERNTYVLTVRIAQAGVQLFAATKEPSAESGSGHQGSKELVTQSSQLLTARQDYLDTVEHVARGLREELSKVKDQAETWDIVIAAVEERVHDQFEALSTEVGKDRLLLSTEKEELFHDLNAQRQRLIDELQKVVKAHQANGTGEKRH